MKILTLSSVFPNPQQPFLGLFVKERMKYVSMHEELRVVAPVPFSPVDPVARKFKKDFAPAKSCYSIQESGFIVDHPPFLCFPGIFKPVDGFLYFTSLYLFLKRLKQMYPFDLIDSHFAYPDGVAAALLAHRLNVPFTVTFRGTELPYSKTPARRKQMIWALQKASKVICVSQSLGEVAKDLSVTSDKLRIIPNGVDTDLFSPVPKSTARSKLNISGDVKVILTVGSLVPRKGFHRVIRILPELIQKFGKIVYLAVGGGSVEGDFSGELKKKVSKMGMGERVRFEGAVQPEKLPYYYSAADLFVLPTSNEGWANVFMESLACGTPVVSTDIGGNKEVINGGELGTIVPFGDDQHLCRAVIHGLKKEWNKERLIDYARQRNWHRVAGEVISVFNEIISEEKR